MARLTVTPVKVLGYMMPSSFSTPATAVTGNLGAGNGVEFVPTQSMILLSRPTGTGTVTILGTADPEFGRSENLVSQSLSAATWYAYGPFSGVGFVQSDGNVYVECSANTGFIVLDVTGWVSA